MPRKPTLKKYRILIVIRSSPHPLGTVEIAELLGVSRKVAEARMFQLMSEGKISGRKIPGGAGVWIWWKKISGSGSEAPIC